MTVALITDQHLDGRKGSLAFWNYFLKFYEEVFFPTLEKKGIKEIIDLGDTFDNRKGIDFNVWNRIENHYFDRLEEMGVTVHTILGNHCVYYKNTNVINSPDLLLGDYDNIRVYDELLLFGLRVREFVLSLGSIGRTKRKRWNISSKQMRKLSWDTLSRRI